MDENLKEIIKIREDRMIKAFNQNNMQITFVDNFEQLHNYLKRYLCNQKTIALGGSMTLFETGVIDLIRQSDVILYDRYEEGLSRKQMQEVFRKAFTSDIFITSTNALTTDGCLYNVDGNGNRVAAMIYGPKEVIVIAGKNKIFEQFSLTIKDGDFLCIYGKSGSGKTTLLNLLGLLEKPDSGKIIFEGIENPSAKEVHLLQKDKIGYIFQNFGLINDESVESNLLIALKNQKMNKKVKKEMMLHSLFEVGLSNVLEKKIYELSGGEQQSIALARLILKKPSYIFADEPTGNLDEKNAELVFRIIKKFNVEHHATVVFVTHDKKFINFTKNTLDLTVLDKQEKILTH